ncbi:MAG: dicarboxylate/amino acid:cation symporter [Nannocystaceae bacterium]|nr:dicarboxylate/amino acid:cation symporter [Nannocystaceae bacterium]
MSQDSPTSPPTDATARELPAFLRNLHRNLSFWVLTAGVAGYVCAVTFGDRTWPTMASPPEFYEFVLLLKDTFISALRLLVAPVVFFSLLGGLLGLGDVTRLRKIGSVAIGYYVITTFIAICIGLFVVTFIHPWESSGLQISVDQLATTQVNSGDPPPVLIDPGSDSVVRIVRGMLNTALSNPFHALANLNILAIVTNALLAGFALIMVVPKDSPLITGVHHVNAIISKVLTWILLFTPLGIFGIVFDFSLRAGGDLFSELLAFSAVVFGATMFHGLFVLPTLGWVLGRVHPLHFLRYAGAPLLVALTTSSSSAALPVTMKTCEENFGVSKGVSGFVLPLGATMNMDGTALFEGIAAVFLAHLFGIELTGFSLVAVFLMTVVSSVGAPGMPSGSISGMQMVMLAVGIPLEAIGILLVVERPLDTFRTAVNVEGDMIGALVTQRRLDIIEARASS